MYKVKKNINEGYESIKQSIKFISEIQY